MGEGLSDGSAMIYGCGLSGTKIIFRGPNPHDLLFYPILPLRPIAMSEDTLGNSRGMLARRH